MLKNKPVIIVLLFLPMMLSAQILGHFTCNCALSSNDYSKATQCLQNCETNTQNTAASAGSNIHAFMCLDYPCNGSKAHHCSSMFHSVSFSDGKGMSCKKVLCCGD